MEPLAPLPPPAELIAEGALRRPAEVWERLRTLLAGRALLLPSSYPLAITTVAGVSPLVAGLIDDSSALALALVDADAHGVGLVVGVRITSGREWIAALGDGAEARFSVQQEEQGLTVLRQKTGAVRHAMGVVGNTLLLAETLAHLRAGGAYVARTVAPSLRSGEVLELTVPEPALHGVLGEAARRAFTSARDDLVAADVAARARHGGRAPDFGDPPAVIDAVSSLVDASVAVLKSAAGVRVTGSLLDADPLLRIELEPAAAGPARDLVAGLDTGDLSPLLRLPSWTDVAVLFRRAPASGSPSALQSRLEAVLGDRLRPEERRRLTRFMEDVGAAYARGATVGLFGAGSGVGAFALGGSGDPNALERATGALVDLWRVPALSAPVEALAGKVEARRSSAVVAGLSGRVTRVRLHHPGGRDEPAFEIACGSSGGRVAAVFASQPTDTALRDLLEPTATARTLGAVAVVARAVARAGAEGVLAGVLRLQAPSGAPGWAAMVVGSDGKKAWAELGASPSAFPALLPVAP